MDYLEHKMAASWFIEVVLPHLNQLSQNIPDMNVVHLCCWCIWSQSLHSSNLLVDWNLGTIEFVPMTIEHYISPCFYNIKYLNKYTFIQKKNTKA